MAHAATNSVHPYLCLYYIHMLRFDVMTISLLTACVYLLRVPASAFWINLVDHRIPLHGVFTGLLTAVGTAGILLILSVPPSWITIAALPVAIISSIFDGLFYQPLEVLVDSAIIKILGDYKILYENERQYGKWVSAIMTLGIGWSLNDDHDFDTLMVTILIGSVILFLLSLSTTVQAADPSLLGITCNEVDETTPLAKHALQRTNTSSSCVYYKPYSLFGEQLSHISEEDASMLQRMTTANNSVSIKPLPRPASVCSGLSYLTNTTTHLHNNQHIPGTAAPAAATEYEDSACFFHPTLPSTMHSASYQHPSQYNPYQINYELGNSPPSFELARLPYPPAQSPAVVLITLIPGYHQNQSSHQPTNQIPISATVVAEDDYYHQCSLATHHYQQQSKWILKSFICSTLCLGIVFGMTQSLLYIHLHDNLKFPMHLIGVVGLATISADILASKLVIRIIQNFSLPVIIGMAHIILVLCTLTYTWLQPEVFSTKLIVILLQFLQCVSFQFIWLLAAHQVDSVILTDRRRMMLKGGMAALYSSLGPAIGVLFMGNLINALTDDPLERYTSVYQYAAGLSAVSSILSWEWSTTN
ncbi:uncharacterized protein ATC70_010743 [Mucor velutinosus]|uniref:Major facilitator superfamily associated domain-containing protein n=1 Tax=Mucor velutinosus TaxID=708070 RepID=A0AAN7DFT2_9FUNG|nr:hypothetical protein ATC70_010743 [Mucor velutinosus]